MHNVRNHKIEMAKPFLDDDLKKWGIQIIVEGFDRVFTLDYRMLFDNETACITEAKRIDMACAKHKKIAGQSRMYVQTGSDLYTFMIDDMTKFQFLTLT